MKPNESIVKTEKKDVSKSAIAIDEVYKNRKLPKRPEPKPDLKLYAEDIEVLDDLAMPDDELEFPGYVMEKFPDCTYHKTWQLKSKIEAKRKQGYEVIHIDNDPSGSFLIVDDLVAMVIKIFPDYPGDKQCWQYIERKPLVEDAINRGDYSRDPEDYTGSFRRGPI